MARNGLFDKKSLSIIPMCAGCHCGKLTKKPWQSKGQQPILHTVTRPGQVVSVDQLESISTGLSLNQKDC